jgi:hypothetical protein
MKCFSDCDDYFYLFRRNHYDIIERMDDDTCSCRDTGLNLTRTIDIKGHHLVPNCSIQFTRATALTLQKLCAEGKDQFITNLNHCVPLTQINDLHINYDNVNTDMLIEILCYMPNLDSLTLYYCQLQHVLTRSARQEDQIAHLVSTNKITKVVIRGSVKNTLEDLQFLVNLCPRIEDLEILFNEDTLEYIAQIVSSKHISSSIHLFSLLIRNINPAMVEKFRTMIGYDNILHNDYTFEHINNFLSLWW